jgi:putative ABC transport system permease protein
MNVFELLSLIVENLGRRKGRVALTAIGVVIGTASIVVLVSLGMGLQQNATQSLYGIGDLTLVHVYPVFGGGEGMAVREIGGGGGGGTGGQTDQKLITDDSVQELFAIPGVLNVIPRDNFYGGSTLKYKRLEGFGQIIGLALTDLGEIGITAERGTSVLSRGTAVVGAQVGRNFYDPRDPSKMGMPSEEVDLLDQTLTLSIMKWDETGTMTTKNFTIKVTGVLDERMDESDWSIYMSIDDVTKFNEWSNGRRINRKRDGYSEAVVKVDSAENVIAVTDKINQIGYQAYTPASYVEGINSFFVILQVVFGGIGAISLLVAAIGIANTMAMAILERTREIGLMKAVGASNRDILSVFLGEASGIGFLGGLGGVILGWSLGQVVNVLAVSYLAGQAAQNGTPAPTSAVISPPWLLAFALLFATFIGLVSGLYPALRAATLMPVTALKYE